jgi:glycerol kinase
VNVLAIDQGTSSTKALVIDADGRVLGEGQAPVSPRASADGTVLQDPLELERSVILAGRTALAAAGEAVSAIGLGNQGETVLRWDRDSGQPLGPAISWQDRRAAVITRELSEQAELLESLSGLPLDPYFAAPKMTLLAREGAGAGVITTIDAWLTHRLTGAFVTDRATASRTMLMELAGGQWSAEACAIFALEVGALPEIVGNAQIVGETDAFGALLPVGGLIVDQQAALFAQSCHSTGEAKCTYGTGAFILANAGPTAVHSTSRLAACVAWDLGGATTYCLDGQTYTAGAAISWLSQIGLLIDASRLDDTCAPGPPRAQEPLFVPALAGLGAPYWAPHARGGWVGLSLATGAGDLVRAVLWGIAAQVAVLAGSVGQDLGRPLTRLRVDGGLSRSVRLLQAQADLLQVPVERYPAPDATAIGVGAMARLASDSALDPKRAVAPWEPSAVFEPSISADQAAEHLADFEAAAEAVIGFGDRDR